MVVLGSSSVLKVENLGMVGGQNGPVSGALGGGAPPPTILTRRGRQPPRGAAGGTPARRRRRPAGPVGQRAKVGGGGGVGGYIGAAGWVGDCSDSLTPLPYTQRVLFLVTARATDGLAG